MPIICTLLGIFIFFSEIQLSKAPAPISFTPLPRLIEFSFVHFKKAFSFIFVTLSGIVTLSNPVTPANNPVGISFLSFVNVIVCKLAQSVNGPPYPFQPLSRLYSLFVNDRGILMLFIAVFPKAKGLSSINPSDNTTSCKLLQLLKALFPTVCILL